jgi:REP element-mobilizing transposase RayT
MQKMSADNYFITDQNAVYFFTFTVTDWVDIFTRKEYRCEITNSLNYCIKNKGLKVYAWCLMSNHMHLVCRAREGFRISEIIRDFKKFTSKAILKIIQEIPESRRDWLLYRFEFAGKFDNRIKKYKFWQETNHAVLLHTNEMIEQRINYIHENPVRALIVGNAYEYLFSSARDFAGEQGYVEVQTEI